MLTTPPGPATGRRGLVRLADRFRKDRRGVSAVEFALIVPILAALLGGAIEFSGATTASNRATYVADALAEMVSRADHTLTSAELKNSAVAASLVDPDIIKYARLSGLDLEKAFKVTISSVQFEKAVSSCTSSCAYTAKTVFSYTLNGTARPCGALSSAGALTTSMSALPADVFAPGSLVVVDVDIAYKPVMPVRLASTMNFKRSSYFRPRYLARINSDANCAGF